MERTVQRGGGDNTPPELQLHSRRLYMQASTSSHAVCKLSWALPSNTRLKQIRERARKGKTRTEGVILEGAKRRGDI